MLVWCLSSSSSHLRQMGKKGGEGELWLVPSSLLSWRDANITLAPRASDDGRTTAYVPATCDTWQFYGYWRSLITNQWRNIWRHSLACGVLQAITWPMWQKLPLTNNNNNDITADIRFKRFSWKELLLWYVICAITTDRPRSLANATE